LRNSVALAISEEVSMASMVGMGAFYLASNSYSYSN